MMLFASNQLLVTLLLMFLLLFKVLFSRPVLLKSVLRWVLPKLALIWELLLVPNSLNIASDGLSTTVLLLTLPFQPKWFLSTETKLLLTSQTRLLALSQDPL